MKNITTATSEAEIHDYMMGLWQSDIFKDSHRSGGYIKKVVDQFAKLPRVFCETSNDPLERAHFCTWWGVIMLRKDYTNPIIHDLYLLHEIVHAGTMPYSANIGPETFFEKMTNNELWASVVSEISVYFELGRALRDASFSQPIYADRYLSDPDMQRLWLHDREGTLNTFCVARREVMLSKPEHLMDFSEKWIRRFADQNRIFAIVWKDGYPEIERHMTAFQQMTITHGRESALKMHVAWLEQQTNKDPVDHIPFRQEAELFTPFYWVNKQKYAADLVAQRLNAPSLPSPSTSPRGDGPSPNG